MRWIKKREAKNNMKILTFNDSDFLKQLELCVKYGFPCLFQDVNDYIDPIVDNILAKNIKGAAGRETVLLGDKEIDYEPSFRLYLNTKLANPKYPPNVYGKVSVTSTSVHWKSRRDLCSLGGVCVCVCVGSMDTCDSAPRVSSLLAGALQADRTVLSLCDVLCA